jgi:hypothetical protein
VGISGTVYFQIYRSAEEEVEEAGPGAGCGSARLGLTTQLAVHGWSPDLGLRQSERAGEGRRGLGEVGSGRAAAWGRC